MNETPIYDKMNEPDPYDQDKDKSTGSVYGGFDPDKVPNAVIENPKVRYSVNVVLGIVGLLIGALVAVDTASDAVDFAAWLVPVIAVYSFMAGAFGLIVTTPNVPRSK